MAKSLQVSANLKSAEIIDLIIQHRRNQSQGSGTIDTPGCLIRMIMGQYHPSPIDSDSAPPISSSLCIQSHQCPQGPPATASAIWATLAPLKDPIIQVLCPVGSESRRGCTVQPPPRRSLRECCGLRSRG